MARKRHKQRAAAGMLGKDLTRRSRGICELCDSKIELRPYELTPFPEDPDIERALLACGRCRSWLDGGEIDPLEARFLSTAVWSDLAPVKLAAARLLLAVDDADDPWVRDALEVIDVDPRTGEFRVHDGEGAA